MTHQNATSSHLAVRRGGQSGTAARAITFASLAVAGLAMGGWTLDSATTFHVDHCKRFGRTVGAAEAPLTNAVNVWVLI